MTTAEREQALAGIMEIYDELDQINRKAVCALAHALTPGQTTEEAYKTANAILIAAGREPVPRDKVR